MALASWLRNRKSRPSGPAFRPRLTVLEDRAVPSFGWATTVGDTAALATSTAAAVATDSAGNIYTTGSYTGDFAPAGSALHLSSAGASDAFVAKYSRSGAFQWAVSLGGAGTDNATGVAVDSAGNAFVTGLYNGPANFGSITLSGSSNDVVFAAKLDPNGNVLWARNGLTVGGAIEDGFSSPSIAVDGTGNAYVSDAVHGTVATDNITIFQLAGGTGAIQWTDQFAGATVKKQGTGDTEFPKLAVGGGNVYVSGAILMSVDFDPGPGTYVLNGSGGAAFVAKLTTGGAFVWADLFTGSYFAPAAVAADTAGNVYTTGWIEGKVNFNPQGTLNLNGGNYGASFVTKLTPAGTLAWAKLFGVGNISSGATADSLAVDSTGAVYVIGSFTGTTSFNPAGGGKLTSAGGADIFVSKLDTNGNYQWAVDAGGSGSDVGSAIAVDSVGDVDIAGAVASGVVAFDPTHSLATATQTAFLWQVTQP